MSHFEETCKAVEEAYKTHKVDALREARDKAQEICEEANIAYLTARDAYHKVYRDLWSRY